MAKHVQVRGTPSVSSDDSETSSESDESIQDPLAYVATNYEDQDSEDHSGTIKWEIGGFLADEERNSVFNHRCCCISHKDSGSCRKPPYSYTSLIAMAIQASPEKKASLEDIFSFISKHFPYYKIGQKLWQNSIKHILALTKFFVRDSGSSIDYWMIGVPLNNSGGDHDVQLGRQEAPTGLGPIDCSKLKQDAHYKSKCTPNFSSTKIQKSIQIMRPTNMCSKGEQTNCESLVGSSAQNDKLLSGKLPSHQQPESDIYGHASQNVFLQNRPPNTFQYCGSGELLEKPSATACGIGSCGITHPIDMSCMAAAHYFPPIHHSQTSPFYRY